MKATNGIVSAPSSTHALSAFMAYEAECRKALQLLFVGLLNMAEGAGWSRRAAASAPAVRSPSTVAPWTIRFAGPTSA